MKTYHTYDFVQDTQKVFRTMLDCLANPGRIHSISHLADKLPVYKANLTVLALSLLDNEVFFYAAGDLELEESLAALTLAVPAPRGASDFLFLPAEHGRERMQAFEQAKIGSLSDPHESATLFIESETLYGAETIRLEGPGIEGELAISVSPVLSQSLALRSDRGCRFPFGMDLFFVDLEGNLIAFPRTTRMKDPDSI